MSVKGSGWEPEGAGAPSREIGGTIAFIGIGSNLGDPAGNCREAIKRLAAIPGTRLLRSSSLYRTEPVGPPDQDWFVNAVAEIRTMLSPQDLLRAVKEIERNMGRAEAPKWGPRIIDLDILLYGQSVVRETGLTIPHPELHKRRFVLAPLSEMASYAIHPAFGITVRGLLDRLEDTSCVEPYEPAGMGGMDETA